MPDYFEIAADVCDPQILKRLSQQERVKPDNEHCMDTINGYPLLYTKEGKPYTYGTHTALLEGMKQVDSLVVELLRQRNKL